MKKKLEREWKKAFESDLSHICYEIRDLIKTPAMVLVEGEMGAGKTTFCKTFIGNEDTLSPTYSLIYETSKALHADLYRLEGPEDLIHLELPMYLEGKDFFLVEWGEKYANQLNNILSEEHSCYLLEVVIDDSESNTSRSYHFYSIDLNT